MSVNPNEPRSGDSAIDQTMRSSLRERVRLVTRQIESQIIMETLAQHRWNRRRTAEALRISYRSLMYKMKNCNLHEVRADSTPKVESKESWT